METEDTLCRHICKLWKEQGTFWYPKMLGGLQPHSHLGCPKGLYTPLCTWSWPLIYFNYFASKVPPPHTLPPLTVHSTVT